MKSEFKKFEVGQTYTCRSICDHECVWSYKVISRTESTIKTECGLKLRVAKHSEQFGEEMVYPQGRYSMAPVLTPSRKVGS